MSNIINAIINLVNNPVTELKKIYSGKNRANNTGDALEEYVKDLFAGTFDYNDEKLRMEKISEVFSYLGNNSNPPDAMLRAGDAIEVKKIETNSSQLALNSSYPKQKLYSDSVMISKACKSAEIWSEKDMIYIVGIVEGNILKHLCMVYGMDYCASADTYERIKNVIKVGIETIPNIELSETKELGKLNKIDPLGITYLRVRGMWGIENPFKVFNYVFERDMSKKFNFMAIINNEKYNTFDNRTEFESLLNNNENLSMTDVKIKNPDNPAQLKNAKLISFSV
ncbi:MAG: NgoPII family restriction endonuclease [Clostridia bacterium]|nr:NgoPII family restriction endonuclease [Clostridia bacterium]